MKLPNGQMTHIFSRFYENVLNMLSKISTAKCPKYILKFPAISFLSLVFFVDSISILSVQKKRNKTAKTRQKRCTKTFIAVLASRIISLWWDFQFVRTHYFSSFIYIHFQYKFNSIYFSSLFDPFSSGSKKMEMEATNKTQCTLCKKTWEK